MADMDEFHLYGFSPQEQALVATVPHSWTLTVILCHAVTDKVIHVAIASLPDLHMFLAALGDFWEVWLAPIIDTPVPPGIIPFFSCLGGLLSVAPERLPELVHGLYGAHLTITFLLSYVSRCEICLEDDPLLPAALCRVCHRGEVMHHQICCNTPRRRRGFWFVPLFPGPQQA